ncbi:MAG: hypothetical protein HYZ50_09190 [Deltaproteobacteria bacterium]|nr:hypothetical protein [Deltaproteobacteria bacterium]
MSKRTLIVAIAASLLFIASCKRQSTTNTGLQPNTIKEFTFQGGTFKDGKINVAPDIKVEPGQAKNTVTLMRPNGNGIKVTCFCVLEGGDCWAVSNPIPGGVGVGCASQNCAGGGEPFCFMDIGDDANGFNIRLAVASRQ